jgi:hypothetical protein
MKAYYEKVDKEELDPIESHLLTERRGNQRALSRWAFPDPLSGRAHPPALWRVRGLQRPLLSPALLAPAQ